MSKYSDVELEAAHAHSSAHRDELARSEKCACFYCCKSFSPAEIEDWTCGRDGAANAALCPKCGIDSVLGDASSLTLDAEFLEAMHARWFQRTSRATPNSRTANGDGIG